MSIAKKHILFSSTHIVGRGLQPMMLSVRLSVANIGA